MLGQGIIIHPFIREEEGRDLVKAIWDAFRENWGNVERPFELEYECCMHILDSENNNEAAKYWLIAAFENEILGYFLCSLEMSQDPEEAWIYSVGVQPAWRRRGIALALLQHSFRILYQKGKRRVSLEVDAQNLTGATGLYERGGMHVKSRYDFYEKELRPGKI